MQWAHGLPVRWVPGCTPEAAKRIPGLARMLWRTWLGIIAYTVHTCPPTPLRSGTLRSDGRCQETHARRVGASVAGTLRGPHSTPQRTWRIGEENNKEI